MIMIYIIPIIHFLMVYGAMYHVPRYTPPVTENTVNGSSQPATVKKDVNQETPQEPKPVSNAETTPPPISAADEAKTLPEQTPPLNTESATKENPVNGSSLPTDKTDANQEIPSEQIPVPNGDTTIPPIPAASESPSLPEQIPSLNTESPTKENTVNGFSPANSDKTDANQEIPPEPKPVANVEIISPTVPVTGEAETLPEIPSLNTESAAQVLPVPSESSVTEQNNEAGNVPVSPEKQDSAPVEVKDLPQENAVPSAVPAEAEMTEVPEKTAE